MSSKTFAAHMKIFGLIGLGIGVILFIVTQAGLEIPIVIGTTSYEGMTSSLMLLFGSLIVLLVIGMIVSIFTSSGRKR